MSARRYAVVVGARPNFVKAAALFHQGARTDSVALSLVHTGQHYDQNMSEVFFNELGLPHPALQLSVAGEFHTEKIGRMFSSLYDALPSLGTLDGVIAFGDVNSSLAAALAATRRSIPLLHIEAGLRSHDRRMPEEINRAIIDHLSDILFTTEDSGTRNLIKEGIPQEKVAEVGNLMIESLELFRDRFRSTRSPEALGLAEHRYLVATMHRQENIDDRRVLESILVFFEQVAEEHVLVLPLHPGTKARILQWGLQDRLTKLHIVDPLGYFEFMDLVMQSSGVLTDSGGIQEETTHLGIACVTLRDNTERPITVDLGSNMLASPGVLHDPDVLDAIRHHLKRTDFKSAHIPLWDTNVAQRIFEHL